MYLWTGLDLRTDTHWGENQHSRLHKILAQIQGSDKPDIENLWASDEEEDGVEVLPESYYKSGPVFDNLMFFRLHGEHLDVISSVLDEAIPPKRSYKASLIQANTTDVDVTEAYVFDQGRWTHYDEEDIREVEGAIYGDAYRNLVYRNHGWKPEVGYWSETTRQSQVASGTEGVEPVLLWDDDFDRENTKEIWASLHETNGAPHGVANRGQEPVAEHSIRGINYYDGYELVDDDEVEQLMDALGEQNEIYVQTGDDDRPVRFTPSESPDVAANFHKYIFLSEDDYERRIHELTKDELQMVIKKYLMPPATELEIVVLQE